jgi:hypothetical protein
MWHEMDFWMRLPSYPNIVPFDRLVVEDVGGDMVVGFTTVYVSGGTLDKDTSRPFKLEYLEQLIHVKDHSINQVMIWSMIGLSRSLTI